MPLYRISGNDIHHNQPREWFAEALTPQAAAGFAVSRGLKSPAVQEIARDAVPPDALVHIIRPPEPSTVTPSERRRRLIMIGLGIGAFLCLMAMFVWKAKEHLGRF